MELGAASLEQRWGAGHSHNITPSQINSEAAFSGTLRPDFRQNIFFWKSKALFWHTTWNEWKRITCRAFRDHIEWNANFLQAVQSLLQCICSSDEKQTRRPIVLRFHFLLLNPAVGKQLIADSLSHHSSPAIKLITDLLSLNNHEPSSNQFCQDRELQPPM